MKISNVRVCLSSEDILGIIEEYVKVDGLKITSIFIDEYVNMVGTYKKGLNISFQVKIAIEEVSQNIITLKIADTKALGIHIFSGIKNVALKKIAEAFKENGIGFIKDHITVNVDEVLSGVPEASLRLVHAEINDGGVVAAAEDVVYKKVAETKEEPVEEEEETDEIVKVTDKYTSFRDSLESKVPEKYKQLFSYGMMVPDIAVLFGRLLKDKRVPFKTKAFISMSAVYLASPIDLLPDFIPFIGQLDDIAVAFYSLNHLANTLPEKILLENWQGKDDLILKLKEVICFLNEAAGGSNINRLIFYYKSNLTSSKRKKKEEEQI